MHSTSRRQVIDGLTNGSPVQEIQVLRLVTVRRDRFLDPSDAIASWRISLRRLAQECEQADADNRFFSFGEDSKHRREVGIGNRVSSLEV